MSAISSQVRVSVVPLTCARCRCAIDAGERHLRHTDARSAPPVRFLECAACARRGGRGPLLDAGAPPATRPAGTPGAPGAPW